MQRMAGSGTGALVSITFMHIQWTASTNINLISNFYCNVIQLLKTKVSSTDPSTKLRAVSASKYMTSFGTTYKKKECIFKIADACRH